jgi:DNA transformation protein and related proteins
LPDELLKLKNIGPQTRIWLHEAGIHSREDIEQLGSVEVYKRLKALRPDKVTLNLLWGLEAALLKIPLNMLTEDIKAELLHQLEDTK